MTGSTAKRPNRVFTNHEREAANRLREIWERKRNELGLTQARLAAMCGWSQPAAFSHYLHQRIPLNIEAVGKLAKVLQVTPDEIMPGIKDLIDYPESREQDEGLERLLNQIRNLTQAEREKVAVLVESLGRSTSMPGTRPCPRGDCRPR